MTFDLITTTYNRPESVLRLVKEAKSCHPAPGQIIVVDSSDVPNVALQIMPGVLYVRSAHKNQPYQRLLGATASDSDFVVFFDDDLEITNKNIFELFTDAYLLDSIIGVSVAIDYQSSIIDNFDNVIVSTNRKWVKKFWRTTGVLSPAPGKIVRLGMAGPMPIERQFVEYFHGPCMSFKRIICNKIIPHELLSQAELKLSMGEDKIISLLSTAYGCLLYEPTQSLRHPANQSTYFSNIRSFTTKVTYSRLYLSRIYAQVFHKPWWREVLIYYWFTAWRVLIALLSLLLGPSKGRKDKLFGALNGVWLALTMPQNAERLTPGIHWETEIQKDLQRAGISQ